MLTDLLLVLLAVLIALSIRTFLFEAVRVKGSSMLSTLQNGDMMFVSRLDYRLHEPARQDVIICRYPGRYMDRWKLFPQYFVKRLIGLPGDTVEIIEGAVYINGSPLDEPYLDPAHTHRMISMPPRTLGADEYFVLGDNRDNSNDSRRIGALSRDMIVGRVRQVFFPFRAWRQVK